MRLYESDLPNAGLGTGGRELDQRFSREGRVECDRLFSAIAVRLAFHSCEQMRLL